MFDCLENIVLCFNAPDKAKVVQAGDCANYSEKYQLGEEINFVEGALSYG